MFKKLGLVFIIFLFLFLRLYKLEKALNFSSEQGLFLNKAVEIYKTGKQTLIGPPASIKSTISREFYHGPATYYLLLPPIIMDGEPLTASFYFIFLNLLTLLIIFYITNKKFGFRSAILASFFFTTFPQLVTYTRFVWNPNFLPLLSSLVLLILLSLNKNWPWGYWLLLGVILGIGLQFHYQAILLIFLCLSWLITKKIKLSKFNFICIGFLIGFSPLIIFELRHNFYNLNTLLLIFKTGTDKTLSELPFYYFLAIMPFIIVFVSFFLNKIFIFNKFIGLILIIIYIFWAIPQISSYTVQAPGMPKGWNYSGQKKAVKIILNENKNNFNIANLLSGDTRAQDLRYLLILKGRQPMDVIDYPLADWLFVLSRYNGERTLKDPVWEIGSFQPAQVAKEWPIQNGISLFLLQKAESKQ